MSDFIALTDKVRSALDELRGATNLRDMRQNAGLRDDAQTSHSVWLTFSASLRKTAGVVRDPQPEQGLAAIWLRKLFAWTHDIEKSGAAHASCWYTLIPDSESLFQLVTNGWESGYRLVKATSKDESILDLITVERTIQLEIEELANAWGSKEPGLPAHLKIYASSSEYGQFLDRAGVLFLRAIDQLEIDRKWLADDQFCHDVLQYADTPSALISPRLSEISGSGLRKALGKYIPAFAEMTQTPANVKYLKSSNHERDEWIYKNIVKHNCKTLQELFDKLAANANWKEITSRKGFKDSVIRYATCHGLEIRFFPDARSRRGR